MRAILTILLPLVLTSCARPPMAPLPTGHDPRACAADSDCELSYRKLDGCCGSLCSPGDAYNKATIPLLDAWHAKHCGKANCPVAGCVGGGPVLKAVCEAGACKVLRTKASSGT